MLQQEECCYSDDDIDEELNKVVQAACCSQEDANGNEDAATGIDQDQEMEDPQDHDKDR